MISFFPPFSKKFYFLKNLFRNFSEVLSCSGKVQKVVLLQEKVQKQTSAPIHLSIEYCYVKNRSGLPVAHVENIGFYIGSS